MRYPILTGMTPILPTVIREDGSPDLEGQGRIIEYLLASGAVAIGHMCGASEYMKVSEYDREAYLSAMAEQVAGRAKLFVGVTDIARRTMIKRAEQAKKLGADMIMCCSPVDGQVSREALIDLYAALGEATDLPLIVQDVGNSAARYTADTILTIIDRVPTVGYVKSEGVDFLPKAKRLTDEAGDTVQVIGGSAGYAMPTLLSMGIRAFMTGTEATDVHADVVNAYLSGDKEKAETLYRMTMLPYLYFYNMNWAYFLKYMLMRRGLLSGVYQIFPDTGVPDPLIITELDLTLDSINAYRGKNAL